MIRNWLATALLGAAWLFGLSYYTTAIPAAWIAAVLLGAVLMAGAPIELPARRAMGVALALIALSAWLMPWPDRAGPLVLGAGLVVALAPQARRWLDGFARGLVAAGAILLVQSVAIAAYAEATARQHDLPGLLVELLACLARLLGADAAAAGNEIALRSFREVHRLAATWDLLVDPASLLFLVGVVTLLALWAAAQPGRWRSFAASAAKLAALAAVWLPLRASLLIALLVDRDQRFIAADPPHVMNHFFSPWILAALTLIFAVAAWRFLPLASEERAEGEDSDPTEPDADVSDRRPLAVLLAACGAGLIAVAVYWDPPGAQKSGRVAFVERHSDWEPSTRPYRTDWYGDEAGYNYAALYDYLGRFYDMSHVLEAEEIDDRRLAACDVLVIKTPTEAYAPQEVQAILRFVQRGGGLLLIGEHTNYRLTSSHLNEFTRPLGFVFRHDLLFGPDVAYDQLYRRPSVPHPAVQRVPPLDFAVSCSIDPGTSGGRSAITSTGLWSLPSDYNMENFFPLPRHSARMRYGAFIQLWAARHGRGRVLAFTDSTIFSNFSVFEPGKTDLMLGMLAWLNRTNSLGDPRTLLLLLALVPLGAAGWLLRGRAIPVLLLIAAGACGAVLAGQAVAAVHRWTLPPAEQRRPMTRVVVDRTISAVPLAKGGFTDLSGQGYGLLEQWVGRLGYFPERRHGPAVFSGDVLVIVCPSRSVPDWYRESLAAWVSAGGRLLVLDSPQNSGSTANSLLWPFGLSLHHDRTWKGQLAVGRGKPDLAVEQSFELSGGQTVARLADHPVAVWTRHGRGAVLAVGFSSLWNDQNMGQTWSVEPDQTQRSRYDLFFKLLGDLASGREPPSATTSVGR